MRKQNDRHVVRNKKMDPRYWSDKIFNCIVLVFDEGDRSFFVASEIWLSGYIITPSLKYIVIYQYSFSCTSPRPNQDDPAPQCTVLRLSS